MRAYLKQCKIFQNTSERTEQESQEQDCKKIEQFITTQSKKNEEILDQLYAKTVQIETYHFTSKEYRDATLCHSSYA